MAPDDKPRIPDISAPLLEKEPFDKNEFESHLPYMGFVPGTLTSQKEKFVHLVVSGMTPTAAGVAVGVTAMAASRWMREDPNIPKAIEYFRQKNRDKLDFSIETAHTMLMEAWTNCKDATEQVSVVRELVKLHGVAVAPKPTEVNINVTNRKQVERASDEKLLELAGVDASYLLPTPRVRAKVEQPVIEAEFSEVLSKADEA